VKKESNLNDYTQKQLTGYQYKINNRPRKKLDFESPKEKFYKLVNDNVAFAS
jgi:IS30 family transposase